MSKLLESRKDIRSALVIPAIGLDLGQENMGSPTYRKGAVVHSCCREGTYGQVFGIISDAVSKKKIKEYIGWHNKSQVIFCGPVMNFQTDETYQADYIKYNNMGLVQYNMTAEAMKRRAYIIHRMESTRRPESPMLTDVMRAAILPLVRYLCGKAGILPEGLNVTIETQGSESRKSYIVNVTGLTNLYTMHHVSYSLVQGAIRAAYELWIEGRFLALRANTAKAVEFSQKDELSSEEENELLKMVEDFSKMLSKKKFKEAPKSYPLFPEVTKYFSAIRSEVSQSVKSEIPVSGAGIYGKAGFFSWLHTNHLADYNKIMSTVKGDRDHNGSKLTVVGDTYTTSVERATPLWRYNVGLAAIALPPTAPPGATPSTAAPAPEPFVPTPGFNWEAVDTRGRV